MRAIKIFRNAVACVLIIFGMLFGALLISSEDVQAAVVKVVIEWFENFAKFSYSKILYDSTDRKYILYYIPDGFKETSYKRTGAFTNISSKTSH